MKGIYSKAKVLFGIGPVGGLVSCVILVACTWADRAAGGFRLSSYSAVTGTLPVILVGIGLALHLWTMYALRNWWFKGKLCVTGPFRLFRHPMYAAWITFIFPGVVIYLNSWICIGGVILIHALWHWLVVPEERMLAETFGDEYRLYAARTGRFVPRLWQRA